MGEKMNEQERREDFQRAIAGLPKFDMSGWVWTEEEVQILRKACAVRFGESVRTETLFSIAAAGMRIAAARGRLASHG